MVSKGLRYVNGGKRFEGHGSVPGMGTFKG